MSSEKVRLIHDLEALRAVANPTRLKLLELLREHGTLTASRCAELLPSTAKSCSYHLHILARSGLVEELSTDDRRERPWRLTYDILETAPSGDKEVDAAETEALWVSVNHNYQAALRFAVSRPELPEPWQKAITITSRVASFTAEELGNWATAMEELTREHLLRASGSAKEGRRRVRLMVYGFPDEARSAPPSGGGR